MKRFFQFFAAALIPLSVVFFGTVEYFSNKFPDTYQVIAGEKTEFATSFIPLCIQKQSKSHKAPCSASAPQKYRSNLTLMNIFPIKTVEVSVTEKTPAVVICGIPFGIKLYTQGVMIIEISDVKTEKGFVSPGKICGLRKGDIITRVNGKNISTNEELETIISALDGKDAALSVKRGNVDFETSLKPLLCKEDGLYRAGIWVRDSSAGIGTLTFYQKENKIFAGLGHGICDTDTETMMPLSHGDIVKADITDIHKGTCGAPGELRGHFEETGNIGKLSANTQTGIYGKLTCEPECTEESTVALKHHINTGPAEIITTVEGSTPRRYSINIDSINYDPHCPTQNMRLSVTDKNLLNATGGIVQGMSGSPIIQNGKLAGAVTHVFVNDPTQGYGIFAETMLTNSNNICDAGYKKAS